MTARAKTTIKQTLLRQAHDLPKPRADAFDPGKRPHIAELDSFRIANDPKLRSRLVMSRLAEVVQAPGRGNWKKRPPTIVRIHPNFDAPLPARSQPVTKPQKTLRTPVDELPRDVIEELREKWQAYYADTRAEVQRRHGERIHNVDPNEIATRARHTMAVARKQGKTLSSRDAVLHATDELTADYESTLRRKYGDLIVDILGLPEFADVSEKERLP
jgi:hypothetical protein